MVWMFMLGAMKRKTPQRFYVLRKNYDLMGGRGLGWFVVVLMAAPAIFRIHHPNHFFGPPIIFRRVSPHAHIIRAVEP
jgi:hypothetical protein